MSRQVLLTGATGFVGRQVLKNLLVEEGVSVCAVMRAGNHLHERSSRISELHTPDLFAEDTNWWRDVCKGVDTVVHVAWYAEPGKYLQSAKNLECLHGTLSMAQGAAMAGVRRFVGVGTCFEYDLTSNVMSVDTPLKPLTPYAGAKAAAYLALSKCLPTLGVEFAWCRLFYLYGQGEDQRRLVPYLRAQLEAGQSAELSSGNQIRDFMDVSDAGCLISRVALGHFQGAANICSGVPISVRQLAEKIADEYGRRDLLKFGARPDNLIDPPCVLGIRSEYQ
jgi:dTDP-6-deoxy-L-talose 4-dehydrogenase (NAD+)